MKILITGINGFIGQHLSRYLLGNSCHEILGTDTADKSNIEGVSLYLSGDIADQNYVTNASNFFENCDAIIHLAACIDKDDENDRLISVNVIGTKHICQLAAALQAKHMIYMSSIPVIGRPIDIPVSENHIAKPDSMYHITKLTGEQIVNLYSVRGIKSTVIRISSPIGPGMPSGTILSVFLKQCLKNKEITILGKGTRRQNYIDVRDICRAVSYVVNNDFNGNELFQIAGGKSWANLELAKLCICLTKSKSNIVFNDVDPEEDNNWDINIAKAYQMFGYYPEYGVEDTIKWLISYANLLEDEA